MKIKFNHKYAYNIQKLIYQKQPKVPYINNSLEPPNKQKKYIGDITVNTTLKSCPQST